MSSNELSTLTETQSLISTVIDKGSTLVQLQTQMALLKNQVSKTQKEIDELTNKAITFMQQHNLKTIETKFHRVTLKEPSTVKVVIEDGVTVPGQYLRTKTIVEPNKEKIKVALKEGETIPGAHLEKSDPTLLIKEKDEAL